MPTYRNKVELVRGSQTETLIDLTSDTVTPSALMQGYTAHDASGAAIVGTATGGGGVYQDENGYLVLAEDGGGGGGGDTWSWMGRNPVKIATMPAQHLTFSDLGLDQWTWSDSTSASTLRASQNYGQTASGINLVDHDVCIAYRVYVHHDYGNWSPKSTMDDFAYIAAYQYVSQFSNSRSMESGIPNSTSSGSYGTSYSGYYYYSNGTKAYSESTNYGVYSNSAPSASTSGSVSSFIVTPKTPVIYARGNSTYFSETAFQNIDFDESYYDLGCEVWLVDHGTSFRSFAAEDRRNILINGGLGVTS